MRIAVLVFSEFPDGAALGRRTHLLSKGWAELGHDVNVVVAQRFREGPLREEFDGIQVMWGTRTTREASHGLGERLIARWATVREVHALVEKGLDWLVVVYPEVDRLPHIMMARRRGVRIAVTYEDKRAFPPAATVYERWLAMRGELADRVIPGLTDLLFPISKYLDARLRQRAPGTPTCLLPAVVDTTAFQENEGKGLAFRERWRLGVEPVLGYMGTYWHVEGLGVFLTAVKELRTRGAAFKVLICGKPHRGHRSDDVRAMTTALGLQEVVTETGWLPREEVIAAMSAADVLVIPKIADDSNNAGLPTKLAEYMAVGRAIVCSDVGDVRAYVREGEDVLLCRPGDPGSLITALGDLLQDGRLRARLAANARAGAVRHFDYRSVARKAAEAMEAILAPDGMRSGTRESNEG
jgi:glycosyltransferase involved in cell wall biosynthesis